MTLKPPGSARDVDLQNALDAAYAAKGTQYKPRTDLMNEGGAKYVNRLIHEASPYLVQHAHNPVDWWPYGADALAEAERLNRPIFLSAGYATCHWCHVMEHESFDNEEVAALLNTHFIAVKLDREQRPDVDQVYILATMLQHRHAGWPNSIWMLPDGRPFHTGTYFQRPHFIQILGAIAQGWHSDQRDQYESVATQLTDAIKRIPAQSAPAADLVAAPAEASSYLARLYNPNEGGFSQGTQFPQEGHLLFLLDHYRRTGDAAARDMALTSLSAIAAGGIHDHVGGGFHRYTVDVNWRTPHFEKMLYNQALLTRAFTQAWQLEPRPEFARAVARCMDYVLRDMTASDGAFYSAEDADSLDTDGILEEGAFYCFAPNEVADDWVITMLGLRETPTLEAGPVPHLRPNTAVDFERLDNGLEVMRRARDARIRPLRDEKVIGGWNGLMIRAMAEAGHVFGRDDWSTAAAKALTAVMSRLGAVDQLARLDMQGTTREHANLSDYAWLGLAAFSLNQFDLAQDLTTELLDRFAYPGGRLALMRDGGPLGPVLETEDGAVPSGEASALELLALLDAARPDPVRSARADQVLSAVSGKLAEMPVARLETLVAARILTQGAADLNRVIGPVTIAVHHTEITLKIALGWHIAAANTGASTPLENLTISGAQAQIPLPSKGPEGLRYEGMLNIPISSTDDIITVTYQPCSDQACLLPVTMEFRVK